MYSTSKEVVGTAEVSADFRDPMHVKCLERTGRKMAISLAVKWEGSLARKEMTC